MTPSWDDLISRNRESARRYIHARVHDFGISDESRRVQDIWVGPPNLWRITDGAGVVKNITGPQWAYRRGDMGMERSEVHSSLFLGTSVGWARTPSDLLVLHREWPAPPEPVEHSAGDGYTVVMTATSTPSIRPVGAPYPDTVDGRPCWTVPCVFTGQNEPPVRWTFDDETGVVVGRDIGSPYQAIEVTDLEVFDSVDPAIFTYDGEYVDAADVERARAEESAKEERFRQTGGKGNTIDRYLATYEVALVIRTDFSDEQAWEEVLAQAREGDSDYGEDWSYEPNLVLIDNPRYQGWGAREILELISATPVFVFLVDSMTLTHPERPLLLLATESDADEYSIRGSHVRVAASAVPMVEANLAVGNLSLGEFIESADEDGILRQH